MFGCQIFKNISAGRIGPGFALFAPRQAHLIEQNFAQLFGRTYIEFLARQNLNFIFKRRHFLRKTVGHPAKGVTIHLNACHFHIGQHRNQRAFQRFINRGHMGTVQLRFEHLPQPQRNIGVFGSVFHSVVYRHPVKGNG